MDQPKLVPAPAGATPDAEPTVELELMIALLANWLTREQIDFAVSDDGAMLKIGGDGFELFFAEQPYGLRAVVPLSEAMAADEAASMAETLALEAPLGIEIEPFSRYDVNDRGEVCLVIDMFMPLRFSEALAADVLDIVAELMDAHFSPDLDAD
jgi:hypothetical protein